MELVSGRVRAAAIYTDSFCQDILGAWDLERKGLKQALDLATMECDLQEDLCEPVPAAEGVYWIPL